MKPLTDKIIESLKKEEFIDSSEGKETIARAEGFKCGIDWAIDVVKTMEKTAEFEEVARILMKHLGSRTDLYHPHHVVIITATTAELVEGQKGIKTNDYIKD